MQSRSAMTTIGVYMLMATKRDGGRWKALTHLHGSKCLNAMKERDMTQKKTSKAAPKAAPKKKYYKTKNEVIEELKSELEAAAFLHREQIAQMQIEHQKELDAAREEDDVIFKMNDDLLEEKADLFDELTMIKHRRFSKCNSVADLADYLSANDLAELLFYAQDMIQFGLFVERNEDDEPIVNPLDPDRTDGGDPAIFPQRGKTVVVLKHVACGDCEPEREMH